MKTPAERGAIGAWAYAARQHSELSVEEVTERLRLRGVSVHPATLRGIEGGTKKPGRALLTGLSDIYGMAPPVERQVTEFSDLGDLVRATERQADAIERLTAVLEVFITSQAGQTQVPPEALRAIAEAEADLAASRGSETPHLRRARREP